MKIALVVVAIPLALAFVREHRISPTRLGGSPCIAADAYTAYHIASLKAVIRSADPDTTAWRNTVHLPAAADTAVAVVSDSATCARGLAAYNTAIADTSVSSLYLIRVSASYVASNPKLRAGEFVQHFVFDSAFVLQSQYMH